MGFTEGDGSFYITEKEKGRDVPGFGITQKRDGYILEKIRKEFKIPTKVVKRNGYYKLDTTNRRAIGNILRYYENKIISRKNVEYKIWAKAVYYIEKGKDKKIERYKRMLRKYRDKKQKKD